MPQRYGPENHDDKSPDGDRPVSRWIEAIDACRPGSDDLAQGELVDFAAELDRNPILAREFRRVQQLDTALVEAVADVPLPEGLQERLLAGLRAASADAAPAGAPSVQAPVTAAVVPISQGASNSRSGRYLGGWITVGGVAALAASVALMVYLRPAPTEIGVDEILQLALDDHQRILSAASAPTALPVVDNTGNKEFPLSNAVVWHRAKLRDVDDFLGRKGVVYEMTSRGGAQASLYVVELAGPRGMRIADDSLPAAPLASQSLNTGGRTVAAWQENGLLYVLVVEDGEAAFGQFIKPEGRVAALESPHPAWFAGNRAAIGSGNAFGIVSLI